MGKYGREVSGILLLTFVSVSFFVAKPALAVTSSSSSYRLDASVDNSFGGQLSSGSYGLVDSGGESIIGNGASGSYILTQGYTAQLAKSIQLTAQTTLNLGTVTAGTSNNSTMNLSIRTDSPGYTLSTAQDHALQSGANTIPPVGGSIASPTSWAEGTTKGLGFTLASTNATAIPGKWSSGAAYAAVPSSSTGFYTRTGYTAGATDTLGVRFRLDVVTTQATGAYSNTVTWTGTTTP